MIAQALRLETKNGHDHDSICWEERASLNPDMEGITLQQLEDQGHVRLKFASEKAGEPFLPFAKGGFQTPSGKAEFYSEALAAQGIDALPTFRPPTESRHTPASEKYPLEMLPRKADNFMNSTFANLAGHRRMEAKTDSQLEMNTVDAASRGIVDGDWVEVRNDRGKLHLQALLGTRVGQGVVSAHLDWNKFSPDGRN